MSTNYWTCLTCSETGTTQAAATRHIQQTQHVTTTWQQTDPAPDLCKCEHRVTSHAYRTGLGNVGRCLVLGCDRGCEKYEAAA